jgi:phosphatidylserine decarboxylase
VGLRAMNWLIIAVIPVVATFLTWLYWRRFYFFRDPAREIPAGRNIVAPADGTIVYANICPDGYAPMVIKKGTRIRLEEIAKTDLPQGKLCHVGIFMSFFDVHVNRIPIDGQLEFIKHHHAKNYSMNRMGLRKYLRLRPLSKNAVHIFENERKTMRINGEFPVYVVQIADAYVSKIQCFAKEGEMMKKGERFGRIMMGSQVDLIFPYRDGMKILVKEWGHVKAGESIIATY